MTIRNFKKLTGRQKLMNLMFDVISRIAFSSPRLPVFRPAPMPLPEPVQQLIGALNKLPGIGPRSAERIALHIVQSDPAVVRQLAQIITEVRERIRTCPVCGALTE